MKIIFEYMQAISLGIFFFLFLIDTFLVIREIYPQSDIFFCPQWPRAFNIILFPM